jgi:hypothetical protein
LVCHRQNATITWILLTFQHVYGLKSLQLHYSFTYVSLSIVFDYATSLFEFIVIV